MYRCSSSFTRLNYLSNRALTVIAVSDEDSRAESRSVVIQGQVLSLSAEAGGTSGWSLQRKSLSQLSPQEHAIQQLFYTHDLDCSSDVRSQPLVGRQSCEGSILFLGLAQNCRVCLRNACRSSFIAFIKAIIPSLPHCQVHSLS